MSGIAIKPQNRGKLHAKLGVPQDKPIPAAKLAKATHSKSPAERKEANFAETAKGWNHAGRSPKQKTAAVSTDRGKFGIKD